MSAAGVVPKPKTETNKNHPPKKKIQTGVAEIFISLKADYNFYWFFTVFHYTSFLFPMSGRWSVSDYLLSAAFLKVCLLLPCLSSSIFK